MSPTLTCEEVIEKMMEYLDRELDEATREEMDAHLQTCRGCFSRAEFERRLKSRIGATGNAEPPEHFKHRLKELIEQF
jgi:mycothiol system anti-sigma-R factor